MICTCTLNPSLDYYMEFQDTFQTGIKNRSTLEYYEAGGKGINVSIILNNLQIPTRACGFVGGFTKEFYITLLQKYEYVQPNFTYIDGHTRINVKLNDFKHATDINAMGPTITPENMKNLREKVSRLAEGDYFVLAGNCPSYLEDDVVEMLKEAIEEGVKVCLDTSYTITSRILPYSPFLVKLDEDQVEEYQAKHSLDLMKQMHKDGAQNILLLNEDAGYAFYCNDDGIYKCDVVQEEKIVSMVGTGDSLVAGFLMNYIRSKDGVDSFRFGACCGSATAYSKGLATREKIDSFYEQKEVMKIEG